MNSERMSVERLAPELDKLLVTERRLCGPDAATAARLSDRLSLALSLTLSQGAPPLVSAVPRMSHRVWPHAVAVATGLALLAGGLVRLREPVSPASDVFSRQTMKPFTRLVLRAPLSARAALSAAEALNRKVTRGFSEIRPALAPAPVAALAPNITTDEADLLQREAALIEAARAALSARELAAADAALLTHQKEFPRGQLAEERDALRIRACLARGDDHAASAEAKQFLNHYPNSALRSQIAALITEPTP